MLDYVTWDFIHHDDDTWEWRKVAADGERVLLQSTRRFVDVEGCIKDAEENGFGATKQ